MSCCGPNRRQLLTLLAAAAALPVLGTNTARAQPDSLSVTDLEVVTVTDGSAVLTWTTYGNDGSGNPVPVDTDSEVWLGPADGSGLRQVFGDSTPTAYHYAEIIGLDPGRAYRFEARSRGIAATPALNVATRLPNTPEALGVLTTLVPPPGRLLRTIALCNDIHFGEEISGLIAAGLPPGLRQEAGLPPYPEVMLSALLDDMHRPDRAVDHLLLAGDLSAEATPNRSAASTRVSRGGGVRGETGSPPGEITIARTSATTTRAARPTSTTTTVGATTSAPDSNWRSTRSANCA